MNDSQAKPIEHQIIRRIVDGAPIHMYAVECVCGRRIALTNSLKIADRKAQYHLDAAD